MSELDRLVAAPGPTRSFDKDRSKKSLRNHPSARSHNEDLKSIGKADQKRRSGCLASNARPGPRRRDFRKHGDQKSRDRSIRLRTTAYSCSRTARRRPSGALASGSNYSRWRASREVEGSWRVVVNNRKALLRLDRRAYTANRVWGFDRNGSRSSGCIRAEDFATTSAAKRRIPSFRRAKRKHELSEVSWDAGFLNHHHCPIVSPGLILGSAYLLLL